MQIITVRAEKCEGCLFGATPLIHKQDVKAAVNALREEKTQAFFCHCHTKIFSNSPHNRIVICRGFYNAFTERFKSVTVRFTKKKGWNWQRYLPKHRNKEPEPQPGTLDIAGLTARHSVEI
jgi:hypothetical protein